MTPSLPAAPERADGRGLFFWQRAPRASSTPAPRRYRIGNLVELLRGSTAVVRSRPKAELFRGARAIVCLRPTFDAASATMLDQCRRSGAFLIADFDDLMFRGPVDDWPDVIAGQVTQRAAERKLAQYRDALAQFDAFTASTEVLAEALRDATGGARVWVVKNGVSVSWWRQGRLLLPPARPRDRVIRYLPGSRHDHDLAVAAEPLGRFLRRHPDVRLEVFGPSGGLPKCIPKERSRHLPRVPFDHLARVLATSWATLAPLTDTPFNRAKSAVKFLESAVFGAPCVATPIPDMQEHEAGGLLLASTSEQWEAALERLLDPTFHRETAERGRSWVEQRGMATRSVTELLEAVTAWTC
jgi:glycosyltransferase involved in cell wall biosynthesis